MHLSVVVISSSPIRFFLVFCTVLDFWLCVAEKKHFVGFSAVSFIIIPFSFYYILHAISSLNIFNYFQ